MGRLGLARWGLWVFTAGIFAWIFPNAALGQNANVVTDVVIAAFGVLAAVGLPRAVDGIGTGPLRWGLAGVAVCQLAQNLITAATGLNSVTAAPVFVVMAASAAVAVGVKLWQEDDWDPAATPWLAAGFAGFAFEPVYYFVRGLAQGSPFGPYFTGALLVAVGGILCAVAFRPRRGETGPDERLAASPAPAKSLPARPAKPAKPAKAAKAPRPRSRTQS